MNTFYLSVLFVLILSSCSSTIFINNDKSFFIELNDELDNEKVIIKMKNGNEIEGIQVKVSSGIIDWLDPKTNEARMVPISEVNKVSIKNNGRGALVGLGIGALTGIMLGGILASETSETNQNNSGFKGAFGSSDVRGFLVMTTSSFLGLTIGATIGATDNYIFNDSQKLNGKNRSQEREIYTIEIKSIIKKTAQYLIVLWRNKTIRIPWSGILELITNDNKIILKVKKETYNTYFK